MPADQVPGNGEFLLYPNIPPMLFAGDYILNATQTVSANGRTAAQQPVDEMDVHISVRSPRLVLPPDQVLSTFPPAESEGSYGSRLPQVVIRRRTLPWERVLVNRPATPALPAIPVNTPWLALVVIAEGEATLLPNVPAAETVTAGITLNGAVDADIGNCLEIRQSMVHRIFPTQKDVPLLAHARHVDINDTELMMGDDDGFLGVVVANRLPVSGRSDGVEIPVKYTACLVNLEQQWDTLLPTAPPPVLISEFVGRDLHVALSTSSMDKHLMGGVTAQTSNTARLFAPAPNTRLLADVQRDVATPVQTKTSGSFSASAVGKGIAKSEVAGAFASEKLHGGVLERFDPTLRFPVLLSWKFTSNGTATFKSLMRGLDSGLLGTKPKRDPVSDAGRLPLELVDTGHVGIAQKTRRGDSVRAWYRGPFVPHPTDDSASARIPLAHAADQLRVVIPDGREDLSLASAFEIGRLLALANPNMVAALLRWRQLHYVTVRRTTIWQNNALFLSAITGYTMTKRVGGDAATELSRAMMRTVSATPTQFLGGPRALVDAGRPLPFDGDSNTLLARAFGLPTLRGDPGTVLQTLQKTPVKVAPITERVGRVPGAAFADLDRTVLTRSLDQRLERLVTESMPRLGVEAPVSKAKGKSKSGTKGRRKTAAPQHDALDAIIERLSRASTRDDA
ncbi:MAG: hypothetical protein H7099_03380 [Gemmatimonadaceae bacterium]|nr:hypothetical protein [Gemmatimonadaceae bacterium]